MEKCVNFVANGFAKASNILQRYSGGRHSCLAVLTSLSASLPSDRLCHSELKYNFIYVYLFSVIGYTRLFFAQSKLTQNE